MPHTQMLEERLRFLNIDHNALSDLQNAKNILEPEMDEMLERFYSHVLKEPNLQALFVNKDSIDRARSAQKNYWLKTLFDGKYDNKYFDTAAQIGRTHARVGLTPNWYIGGYCQMLNQFIELISNKYSAKDKSATQVIQAVNKAIFLDMDLVIHSYLEAKDNSMREILHRATNFTADVKAIIDDIHATTRQSKATAETLSAEAAGQPGATSMNSGTPSEQEDDTVKRINELLAQTEQVSQQMAQLDERLDDLQFGDRLYIADSTPKSGLIARLKAMLLGKK